MKKRFGFNVIGAFVLAQLALFGLLGLWIYSYVANYMVFVEVGERISPQFVFNALNVGALVGGLALLVAVAVAMVLIFSRLIQQLQITRMYDNFIANVTHELKSPLAAIQLYLETMSARDVPPEKRAEFIERMMKDAQRLDRLIHSLLDLAGLKEKRRLYQPQVFRADALVGLLVAEAVEQFQLPPGSVEVHGLAPCACRTDRRSLQVVMNNLFDNAIKYSRGPVHITVSLRCVRRWFVIEVADRGVGIAKKDQQEVFKKFTRLYNSSNPSVKGTGLGLYWVREIVRNHQGRVRVFSEGEGRGTTFRIELPVCAAEAPAGDPRPKEGERAGTG